jgi:hypothetical protein
LCVGVLSGRQTKKPSQIPGRPVIYLIVHDQSLLSGNGFASPLPIKTIQVLAITALIAAFAFIPDLYVVVVIIVVVIEMQN